MMRSRSSGAVVGKTVQGHDGFHTEEPDILDVLGEIAQPAGGGEPAVVGHRLGGGHDDRRRGIQARPAGI